MECGVVDRHLAMALPTKKTILTTLKLFTYNETLSAFIYVRILSRIWQHDGIFVGRWEH